jgi:hypothetical protein
MKDAVNRGHSTEAIRSLSVREGTRLMWRDGARKAQAGLTTADEIIRTVQVLEDSEHLVEEIIQPSASTPSDVSRQCERKVDAA